MKHLKVATIGFTQSSAENFFNRIKGAGVSRVVDVRLHNTSQLAGFVRWCRFSGQDVKLIPTSGVRQE